MGNDNNKNHFLAILMQFQNEKSNICYFFFKIIHFFVHLLIICDDEKFSEFAC
jgi:hypothetical protein